MKAQSYIDFHCLGNLTSIYNHTDPTIVSIIMDMVTTFTTDRFVKLNIVQQNIITNTLKKYNILRAYDAMQEPITTENPNHFFGYEEMNAQAIELFEQDDDDDEEDYFDDGE
jgi:hypothetical protein